MEKHVAKNSIPEARPCGKQKEPKSRFNYAFDQMTSVNRKLTLVTKFVLDSYLHRPLSYQDVLTEELIFQVKVRPTFDGYKISYVYGGFKVSTKVKFVCYI